MAIENKGYVTFNCAAEYGDKVPYSIFREYVEAGSHLHALQEFRSRFFKTFPNGEKSDPDRIVITNMKNRVRITIDEGEVEHIKPSMWDSLI